MSEWKTYRLGDICQVLNGRAYKQEELLNQGPYPVLRVGNIFQGNNWYYSDLELPDDKYCYNGDLLYAWSCGFAPYIWKGKKSIYHYHIWKLKENPQIIDKLFFYYYLIIHTKYNLGGTHGSVMLHLTKKDFENQTLHLPPLDEQRRIAGILGSLDDKIELNRRINANLEAQAQALFRSWFVDFEPFRDGPFVDSELGKIPQGWKVGTASEFYKNITIGKTPPRKEHQWFSKDSHDIVWVSIADMGNCGLSICNSSEYLTPEAIKKFNICIVPVNTVLLSFKLTIGRVAIADKELATNEAIAHFHTRHNTLEYTYLALKNYEFSSLGSTSSIATAVNSRIIKSMPWMMPSDDVLNQFHNVLSPIFNGIRNNIQEITYLSALRDTLLPKLIAGEINIENQ